MKSALREDGPRIYEFGPFRLVPERRLLTCEGRPADMSPKAFELLVILVEAAGHVVNKNDLMKRLWPDTFVEENNLAQAVSNLRQALADDSDSPQYVKTIPRRGYIFTHPVNEVSEGDLAGPKEVVQAPVSISSVSPREPSARKELPIDYIGSKKKPRTLRVTSGGARSRCSC